MTMTACARDMSNQASLLLPRLIWLVCANAVQRNTLSDLPLSLRGMSRLACIDLSQNLFDILPLCLNEMPALHTVDATGNQLRGLPEWIDCPRECQLLTQPEDQRQLAAMSWGVRFSCRACQGTGLVSNLACLESLELQALALRAKRHEHGPWACCGSCNGLGTRIVPLSLALLT